MAGAPPPRQCEQSVPIPGGDNEEGGDDLWIPRPRQALVRPLVRERRRRQQCYKEPRRSIQLAHGGTSSVLMTSNASRPANTALVIRPHRPRKRDRPSPISSGWPAASPRVMRQVCQATAPATTVSTIAMT